LFVGLIVPGHDWLLHDPVSAQSSQDATSASGQSMSIAPQPQSQKASP
jgi:hypothetical protein